MTAREKHLKEIERAEYECFISQPKTPHHRDMAKHLQKLRDELKLYDELMKGKR